MAELGDDTVDGHGDLGEVDDVHRDADAAPAHRHAFLLEVASVGWIAQAQSDVGTGVGERGRQSSPDAPRRPGDQRRAPVESEVGKSTRRFVCHPRLAPNSSAPTLIDNA